MCSSGRKQVVQQEFVVVKSRPLAVQCWVFVGIDRDDGGGGERSYMHSLTCRIAITHEHMHGRSRDIWGQLRKSQEPK